MSEGRDANAVRTAALFEFPAERVIRPAPGCRGEQVVVTHRGAQIVFADPAAMFASARADDPAAAARLAEIAELHATAEQLVAAAEALLTTAAAAKARAERMLGFLGRAAIVAVLLAAICLLGAL